MATSSHWWEQGSSKGLPFPKDFAASDASGLSYSLQTVRRNTVDGKGQKKVCWYGTYGPYSTAKELKESLIDIWDAAYPCLGAEGA
jgi:hypothetical protein